MSFVLKLLLGSGDATTWSATDKAPDIALSNENLTATRASAGAPHVSVRSTTSRSSGKWYFEITRDETNSDQVNIGLVTSALTLNGRYPGDASTGSGIGYLETVFGNVQVQGVKVAQLPVANNAGDIAGFAVDLDNRTCWVRLNGGDWLADPSADPSTNTNGADISTALPGAVFICAGLTQAGGCGAILNTGDQPFGSAVPSGFVSWN